MSDSDVVLKVEGLCKTYYSRPQSSGGLGDALRELVGAHYHDGAEVHALQEVSFELKRGESLGIIGPNGSGKSTLLKILSGVTAPTFGKVTINGRVLSVLDIGTGFHPDLTGRENVYLNGEILGMSRKEIGKKYKEIVDFSGIADFINRPVKQYSSGMYLRLAFSIVVTLDADLLLFDEVMSVGDREFRLKSMNKFLELVYSGKSLVVASHNDAEVLNLTAKAAYLNKGRLVYLNTSDQTIKEVSKLSAGLGNEIKAHLERLGLLTIDNPKPKESRGAGDSHFEIIDRYEADRAGTEFQEAMKKDSVSHLTVIGISSFDEAGSERREFSWKEPIFVKLSYSIIVPSEDINVALIIKDMAEARIMALHTGMLDNRFKADIGSYEIVWELPSKFLGSSMFSVDLFFLSNGRLVSGKMGVHSFSITDVQETIGEYRILLPIRIDQKINVRKVRI